MFYSRIASDAVLPNLEIGFNHHNEPTPVGDLWFATVAALRNSAPSDFTARLLTASLMLHYEADETSAAAALIADNFFLVALPNVPEPVRITAQRFTQAGLPTGLERLSADACPQVLLYRTAVIIARCRDALERRATFCRRDDWFAHSRTAEPILTRWETMIATIDRLRHRLSASADVGQLDRALEAVRETLHQATWAFEDRFQRSPSCPHFRVTGRPTTLRAFLKKTVTRFGLQYAEQHPTSVILRSIELPVPVAVRLFDGLAAAFPHLHFEPIPYDTKRTFQGDVVYEADYWKLQETLEPLFYDGTVNPVAALLKNPPTTGWRITGRRDALHRFRQREVPLFRLPNRRTDDGNGLFISTGHPDSGLNQLMQLLKHRHPELTFRRVQLPERLSFSPSCPARETPLFGTNPFETTSAVDSRNDAIERRWASLISPTQGREYLPKHYQHWQSWLRAMMTPAPTAADAHAVSGSVTCDTV